MADISRQFNDGRECIVVEKTGEWISYQAAMILRLQPEGVLTAYSSDMSRWIGYIRPEGPSLDRLAQMPEAYSVIDNLQKIYETAERLLLGPEGFPPDPELWFYTEGKLSCIYIPEVSSDSAVDVAADSQNPKEKIAYMLLMCAAQKKCPEPEMNAFYRYYLECAGILTMRRFPAGPQPDRADSTEKGSMKYSLSEAWSVNPYIADILPADLNGESLPDLLGEEDPDAAKDRPRRGLFRKREKKRK